MFEVQSSNCYEVIFKIQDKKIIVEMIDRLCGIARQLKDDYKQAPPDLGSSYKQCIQEIFEAIRQFTRLLGMIEVKYQAPDKKY